MANEKTPAAPPILETSTAPKRYVGEAYDKGIVLPDNRLVRPAEFTPREIEDFIRKFPQFAHWWN